MEINSFAITHTDISGNIGGPPGYLFNLINSFNKTDCPDLLILDEEKNVNFNQNACLRERIINKIKDIFPSVRNVLYFFRRGFQYKHKYINIINNYKLIHAHSSEVVLFIRRFCKYRGIIVFTPHRPESIYEEVAHSLSNKRKYSILRVRFNYIEKESYKLSDAFVFPSKGAEHIYWDFPGYEKYGKDKLHKYLYTGLPIKKVTIEKKEYRKKYGIKGNCFIVTYIGRHSMIKGYDRLVKIYPELKQRGIEVVVAGGKGGIAYPLDSGWHELGYISDVPNLIHASDVIVIPNRNTYFDLIILEALSQGRIVISSNTGGNIDIAKETAALMLFDNNNETELLDLILKVSSLSSNDIMEKEKDAIRFYYNKCKMNIFSSNYLETIKLIKQSFDVY